MHSLERSHRNKLLFVTFTYVLELEEVLLPWIPQQMCALPGPRNSAIESWHSGEMCCSWGPTLQLSLLFTSNHSSKTWPLVNCISCQPKFTHKAGWLCWPYGDFLTLWHPISLTLFPVTLSSTASHLPIYMAAPWSLASSQLLLSDHILNTSLSHSSCTFRVFTVNNRSQLQLT